MPVTETKKSLGLICCESTQLQIELGLYPIASVGISLFSRCQICLQHSRQILDIHAGLVSTDLLQIVLLRQLPQYLLITLDMNTYVILNLEGQLFIPCACSGLFSYLVLHQLLSHTPGGRPSNTSLGSWRAWFLGVSSRLFPGAGRVASQRTCIEQRRIQLRRHDSGLFLGTSSIYAEVSLCVLAQATVGTGDVLIPLIFYTIKQASTAVLVVLFRILLFIEDLQLLKVVLRRIILVREEPCFILIILIVVVGKFVNVCQICVQLYTIVCVRSSVIAVVRGTLNQ